MVIASTVFSVFSTIFCKFIEFYQTELKFYRETTKYRPIETALKLDQPFHESSQPADLFPVE